MFKNKLIKLSRLNIFYLIIILGIIGLIRNFFEVYIGGDWANEWFSFSPDILFTMFLYPIFLCFFSATLLHFFSRLFKLNINMNEILVYAVGLQFFHLFIPFFDGLAHLYDIPFRFSISQLDYIKLIFSPLAFTPIIILFTYPTSLGINIAWFLSTIILLRLFIKKHNFPVFKSIFVLCFSFYIIYMSIYPTYYFFINESIIGSNFMFGLLFLLVSIPSIMYTKILIEKEGR